MQGLVWIGRLRELSAVGAIEPALRTRQAWERSMLWLPPPDPIAAAPPPPAPAPTAPAAVASSVAGIVPRQVHTAVRIPPRARARGAAPTPASATVRRGDSAGRCAHKAGAPGGGPVDPILDSLARARSQRVGRTMPARARSPAPARGPPGFRADVRWPPALQAKPRVWSGVAGPRRTVACGDFRLHPSLDLDGL